MIKIAIMGFGTVGQATYQILNERKSEIEKSLASEIKVKKILVRSLDKYKDFKLDSILTDQVDDLFKSSPDLIIELTSSVEPIYPSVKKALADGIHVISANKALISKYFEDLQETAEQGNSLLRYEASVAGGIPIIANVKSMTVLNEITEIKAVLNGTCNFILSKMEEGLSYKDALSQAQDLGFAEADPSADVDGFDTQRKLRILASLAFNQAILETDIPCQGISQITSQEVYKGLEKGQRYKLLAQASRDQEQVKASVKPVLMDKNSQLGSLQDGENAIIVTLSNAQELVFRGFGAGGRPTAFAVLSDLLHIYGKGV